MNHTPSKAKTTEIGAGVQFDRASFEVGNLYAPDGHSWRQSPKPGGMIELVLLEGDRRLAMLHYTDPTGDEFEYGDGWVCYWRHNGRSWDFKCRRELGNLTAEEAAWQARELVDALDDDEMAESIRRAKEHTAAAKARAAAARAASAAETETSADTDTGDRFELLEGMTAAAFNALVNWRLPAADNSFYKPRDLFSVSDVAQWVNEDHGIQLTVSRETEKAMRRALTALHHESRADDARRVFGHLSLDDDAMARLVNVAAHGLGRLAI